MGEPSPDGSDDGRERAESLAQLATRLRTPLVRYFLRRRLTVEAAEDCAQESFARLARADYATVASPESYLFAIASSVAIDRARRAKTRSEGAHVSLDPDLVSEEPSPARVFEGRESLLRLKAALDELPPRTKEIFLLNRMDGLTYTQLAARHAISTSSIEKHMTRALAHLRSRLRDE